MTEYLYFSTVNPLALRPTDISLILIKRKRETEREERERGGSDREGWKRKRDRKSK